LHLHVLQYALARYIMCVMMGGAWSMAAWGECSGWYQTRQVVRWSIAITASRTS